MTEAVQLHEPVPKLLFRSSVLPPGTFDLVHLTGNERLSGLPRYSLELTSEQDSIRAEELLNEPAAADILLMGQIRRFCGVLTEFEFVARNPHTSSYRATLAPRISWLGSVTQSRVFLDKSVPVILGEILSEYGLEPGEDYQLRLRANYQEREYVVQYQETDLAFVSRLMEHEGIYFFFEPNLDRDFVIFTDHIDAHESLPDGADLNFRAGRHVSSAGPAISEMAVRHKSTPRGIILKDYNYRKPSVDQRGAVQAPSEAANTIGHVLEYGDHFKTPEEGTRLAGIRLEERSWPGKLHSGISGYPNMTPGRIFRLVDHFRSECNGEFLVVEVEHDCRQPGAPTTADALTGQEAYRNSFKAIPRDQQFRAPRETPRPRIYGTMHAVIDGSGTDEYAEIDEEGRYKVRLPFDMAGREGGKASRFIRMAQPYAGPDYGSHFPLHKGTEVLLTHIDGDPDRPIIAAAIPNPATASPVRNKNQTQSVVKTAANNQLVLEDAAGGVRIRLFSPTADTSINLGAPYEGVSGLTVRTADSELKNIGQDSSTTIGGDRSVKVDGSATSTVQGALKEQIGTTMQTTVGQSLTISAGTAITLKCGASSIHMTEAGTISISGSLVSMSGTYSANVVAPVTNIVGALMVTVTGALSLITGTITRLTGASKATVSGNTVDVAAKGDANVTGSTVKLN